MEFATWIARMRPERVFMILGGLSMLASLVLIPPFMTPDETTHFKRSYSVSLGAIWPESKGGTPGFTEPASIGSAISSYFEPDRLPLTLAFTLGEMDRPLNPEDTVFYEFRADAIYSPASYIPQSLGILIGRALDVSPVTMVFLARLANLIVAMGLIYWAICILPVGKEVILVVALLPMTQHMLASVNPDALTISGGLLFCAALLRSYQTDDWRASHVLLIIFSGILMCSSRSANAPLMAAGCGVIFLGIRQSWRWSVAIVQGVASLAVLLALTLWMRRVGSLETSSRSGMDPEGHMALLLEEPIQTIWYLVASIIKTAPELIKGLLGVLSWNNIYLYSWHYKLLVLLIIASLLAVRHKPPLTSAVPSRLTEPWVLWVMFLVALVVMVIEFGLFLIWTPVGAPTVEGVQGRYYLPFLPLVPIALMVSFRLQDVPNIVARYAYSIVVAGLAISSLATTVLVIGFFQLL